MKKCYVFYAIAVFLFCVFMNPINAQTTFSDFSSKIIDSGKVKKGADINGGYYYNCSGSCGWFSSCCNIDDPIKLEGDDNKDYFLQSLNYSMNSDSGKSKNSIEIKLKDDKHDFVLGAKSASKNESSTDIFNKATFSDTGTIAIGVYSGSTSKYSTGFSISKAKDLFLGGTLEIGGHYSGGSIYRGGNGEVKLEASNNIYSNANILISHCTTSGCPSEDSYLELSGINFYSNGSINLGNANAITTSNGVKLDLGNVQNSYLKNITAGAQSGKNQIIAQNLIIDSATIQWNNAELAIYIKNQNNTTQNASANENTNNTQYQKAYKDSITKILEDSKYSTQQGEEKYAFDETYLYTLGNKEQINAISDDVKNLMNAFSQTQKNDNVDTSKYSYLNNDYTIINKLSNSTTENLNSGVNATLKINNAVFIGNLLHVNAAGGKTFTIDTTKDFTNNNGQSLQDKDGTPKDIIIGQASFKNDGLAGSQSIIDIKGNNIMIGAIQGCGGIAQAPFSCGIGNLNQVKASGNSFYAGLIQAVGAPTLGGDSVLDLSNIKNSHQINSGNSGIYIKDLDLRLSTFKATSFFVDNFNVWKGYRDIVGLQHETSTIVQLGSGSATTNGTDSKGDLYIGYINKFNLYQGSSAIDSSNIVFEKANAQSSSDDKTKSIYMLYANYLSALSWSSIDTTNLDLFYVNQAAFKYMGLKASNLIFNTLSIADDTSSIQADSINIMNELHLINTLVTKSPQVTITLNNSNNADNTYSLVYKDHNENYDKLNSQDKVISPSNIGSNIYIDNANIYALRTGTLNNYGNIILDGENVKFKGYQDSNSTSNAVLTINGNLYNFNDISVGNNAKLIVNGDFLNFGNLEFILDSKVGSNDKDHIKVGSMEVYGKAIIDISPGARPFININMPNFINMPNTIIGQEYTILELKDSTNTLQNNRNNNSFIYTYSLGGSTTIITKEKNYTIDSQVITDDNDKNIKSSDAYITALQKAMKDLNNQTKDATDKNNQTIFEKNGMSNPWDDEKAKVDIDGKSIEKDLGMRKSLNTKCAQNDNSCGSDAQTKTQIEATNKNAYNWATNKASNSIVVTSNDSDLLGKYLRVNKNVTENKISFTITMLKNEEFNANAAASYCNAKSSTFDCLLYTEAGNTNEWIDAIKQSSVNSYEILKSLFYNSSTQLQFIKLIDQSLANSRNINYFTEMAQSLDNALHYASDLSLKQSALDLTIASSIVSRTDRLVKLSSVYNKDNAITRALNDFKQNNDFYKNLNQAQKQEIMYKFSQMKFASTNDEVMMTALLELIRKYEKINTNPNNIWINLMGQLNFNVVGNQSVYGFNAGYDYFFKNTAIGIYAGYGRGSFSSKDTSFLSNYSNNITSGIYTRSFIGNEEIDFSLNYALGMVNETMQNTMQTNKSNSANNLLTIFNQQYDYLVHNASFNVGYGHSFIMKKGYVFKPFIALGYEYGLSSDFNGKKLNMQNFLQISEAKDYKNNIVLNIGIEARKYYKNGSYIFITGSLKQDILAIKNNTKDGHNVINIYGLNPINLPNGMPYSINYIVSNYNSIFIINTGGEIAFNRFFINGSVNLQNYLNSSNFSIGASLGARFVF